MGISPEQYAQAGSEHAEQVALFMWCHEVRNEYPELQSLFAIPNGGLRHKATAGRLKAEGVKDGVSDVMLPLPITYRQFVGTENLQQVRSFAGLFIEMKKRRAKNIRNDDPEFGATPEQRQFIALMKQRGYSATVCHGWENARDVLLSYLKLRFV